MRWFFFILAINLCSIHICDASNPPTPSLGESKSNPPLNHTENKNKPTENNQTVGQTAVPIGKQLDTTNIKSQTGNSAQKEDSKPSSDWWLVYLTAGLVVVGIGQAVLFLWQLSLIRQSMVDSKKAADAAEKAANAAIAALERPWLILEEFKLNELNWSTGNGALRASFKISNYGKAPAIIKGLWVTHFRGPHHHNGRPPLGLPNGVRDVPDKDNVAQFIMGHKNRILDVSNKVFPDTTFIVSSGKSTETFYFSGWGTITHDIKSINPITLTESYLMGIIYYEILGQPSEVLHFTYKSDGRDSFSVFNDYAPYNERKKAKPET